jgi:hypothetical protein
MHALAFILCFVGLLILTLLGEEGALFQLLFFIACIAGAVMIAGAVIAIV